MKKILFLILALIIELQFTNGQVSKKYASFTGQDLPGFSGYFSKADTTVNGILIVYGTGKYAGLLTPEKQTIISRLFEKWDESILMVKFDSRTEFWGRSNLTGRVSLLEVIDTRSDFFIVPQNTGTIAHPWFVYLGFQISGDNKKNINLALNTRLGFFLLKNRWDLAATFTGGLSGNLDYNSSAYSNLGLMTKVYFPIRKIGLNPNIGAQVSAAFFEKTDVSLHYSLILGVSWYIGVGSIDVGVNIGDIFTASGGFTFMPGLHR